jgi:hypothetical protein
MPDHGTTMNRQPAGAACPWVPGHRNQSPQTIGDQYTRGHLAVSPPATQSK